MYTVTFLAVNLVALLCIVQFLGTSNADTGVDEINAVCDVHCAPTCAGSIGDMDETCLNNCRRACRRCEYRWPLSRNPVVKGESACLTNGGPNPGKECIFPFTFQGITYTGCALDLDDLSKTWCSTKVDSNGKHVMGQDDYGYCSNDCPKHKA